VTRKAHPLSGVHAVGKRWIGRCASGLQLARASAETSWRNLDDLVNDTDKMHKLIKSAFEDDTYPMAMMGSLFVFASILIIESSWVSASAVRAVFRGFVLTDISFMALFALEAAAGLWEYGPERLSHPIDLADAITVSLGLVIGIGSLLCDVFLPSSLIDGTLADRTSLAVKLAMVTVVLVRGTRVAKMLRDAGVGSRLMAFVTRLLRNGIGSELYSAKRSIFLICSSLFTIGLVFTVQGAVSAYEIEHSTLLAALLPDVSSSGIYGVGLLLLFLSVLAVFVTQRSPSQQVTLALLVALAVALACIAGYINSLDESWEGSIARGRKVHYNSHSLDTREGAAAAASFFGPNAAKGEEGGLSLSGTPVDSNDVLLWERMRFGFEAAYVYCNGTVYQTDRVNAACADLAPGADCARNLPGRYALFCRNQYGNRKLTIRALYHAREWDPSYEFGARDAGGDVLNDAFDWMVSTMCLAPGGQAPLARVDEHCLASSWWGEAAAPAHGAPFVGAEADEDAAVFAALGQGDLALSAKQLFCLCGAAPEVADWVEDYLDPVSYLAWLLALVACMTSTLLFCLCCCIEDADRYYDPELL